jgi:DNA modification methylase
MSSTKTQISLFPDSVVEQDTRSIVNRLSPEDEPRHNWYRFVLGFPPHLVRRYLTEWNPKKEGAILDPFCGTGTTPLEARLNGYRAFGVEMNPFAAFASRVKTDFEIEPNELRERGRAS